MIKNEAPVFGMHAVSALLAKSHRVINTLYISQERKDQKFLRIVQLAKEKAIPIEALSAQEMHQRFGEFKHQGVVACAEKLLEYNENNLLKLLGAFTPPLFNFNFRWHHRPSQSRCLHTHSRCNRG